MRRILLLALVYSTPAVACPDGDHEDTDRPTVEWSTWFRLGFGIEPRDPGDSVLRSSTSPERDSTTGWSAALGADASVGIDRRGDIRLGAWGELRGLEAVGGGELVLTRVPKRIDMFLYDGQGILALRAGGGREHASAAIAYGYLAPWKLWGPWNGATRYMIGVRVVATYTRAWDDPRDWSATIGLETEPFGALRYLLGIRSLY